MDCCGLKMFLNVCKGSNRGHAELYLNSNITLTLMQRSPYRIVILIPSTNFLRTFAKIHGIIFADF